MFRILVTDTLAESGLAILRAQRDVELDYRPGLSGAELHGAVAAADALITRSGTAVTEELLSQSSRLKVVGRAGVGLDNVDVPACTRRGVLVINAPTANILSATEHTMAMLLSLCRNIPGADASVRAGEWKRSRFMGVELGGKTLGVIGLGRIGGRVATRARAFGMRILAYDPYITEGAAEKVGADLVSLDTILAQADVITVHTPLTDETRGIVGAGEISRMKDGVILVNCARGGIYDERALADALAAGKVAGAAIDVYVDEPPDQGHPLLSAPNVILTPHIGANTIEAQDRVAVQTSEMVVDALRGSIFVSAVNLPFEGLAETESSALIGLAERLGSFVGQLVRGRVSHVTLELRGIEEKLRNILAVASIKGLLQPVLKETVNYVNAQSVASQRGIDFATTLHQSPQDYTHLLSLNVVSDTETMTVSGTVFGEKIARVVAVNDFRVEFEPAGCLLYMVNRDVPGVIGKVGTILGDREINIAEYNLARVPGGGRAMAVVAVDSRLDDDTLAFLRSFREMEDVRQIAL
jgi:D-3-phosphoglycerate dehydrogenase / 2-oxoglutarate reductase